MADDDPVRYAGATIIGQAFEQQWLDLDHNKSAFQQAQFVTGESSGTEPEEDADGGIVTPVARPRSKRARVDPYELMQFSEAVVPCRDRQEARGSNQGAAATPLDEDAFPLDVAVDSMSEESLSDASDTDADTPHLEDSAFTRLLHDKISSGKHCPTIGTMACHQNHCIHFTTPRQDADIGASNHESQSHSCVLYLLI